jgi:hypothetical protein
MVTATVEMWCSWVVAHAVTDWLLLLLNTFLVFYYKSQCTLHTILFWHHIWPTDFSLCIQRLVPTFSYKNILCSMKISKWVLVMIFDRYKGGSMVTRNLIGVVVCYIFDPEGCGLLLSFICQHKPSLNVCMVCNVYGKIWFLSLYQTHLVFIKICIYSSATVSLIYSLETYIILQNLKILYHWLLQMIYKVYMISKDKEMAIVCIE